MRRRKGPEAVGAPTTCWIGLGANLGDAPATLGAALAAMAALPDTELLRCSQLYKSAPVDADGPDYYNAVAALRTTQAPLAFLQALQAIEQAGGRERPYRNAPRTLDLDILLWGEARIDQVQLSVPHPRLYERAFVLLPLAELHPGWLTPAQLQAVAGQRIECLGAWAGQTGLGVAWPHP